MVAGALAFALRAAAKRLSRRAGRTEEEMTLRNVPGGGQPEEGSAMQERRTRRLSPQILLGSVLTLCAGLAIAWVDTRPRWDDTGLTAGALLIAAAAGSFARVPPWLAAGLVAGPIIVAELADNTGILVAIPFALAGAYAGAIIRWLSLRRWRA